MRIEIRMVSIADEVVQPLGEVGPAALAVVARVFRLCRAFVHPLAKLIVRELSSTDAQNVKSGVGAANARQVIQRWNQLTLSQVSRATEDHQEAGACLG